MRFDGQIKKTPCIDYFEYHKSIREGRNRMMLISDFQIEGCFDIYAVIYGKFDGSFCCDGISPFLITENSNEEVQGDIQISGDLIKRLENDNETSPENIEILKRELR